MATDRTADGTSPQRDGEPAGQRRHRRHLHPGRRRRIAPTFTEEEYADIVTAAAAAGVTPTGFCAEAALSVAREVRSAALDPARQTFAELQVELFDARVALGRIGTNLNQAVSALNTTGVAPDWLERVAALCERRMEYLDGVIAQVERRLP